MHRSKALRVSQCFASGLVNRRAQPRTVFARFSGLPV